jgi:hypothetical protein
VLRPNPIFIALAMGGTEAPATSPAKKWVDREHWKDPAFEQTTPLHPAAIVTLAFAANN